MTKLQQVHSTTVPEDTYYWFKHQAVDLDISGAKFLEIILSYLSTRPITVQDIYESWMNGNGHAETVPEMKAVGVGL